MMKFEMDREQKVKIAGRVAVISGVFCALVALLLILNFWQMKQHEPLESKAIEALVERLRAEPNNEELKEEIRSFDLLARKAYFTSRWQIRAGTWLLLFGGILLAVSVKVYTDARISIEPPEESTEELLKARANSQYWLFMAGGLVLGLALVAAWLSNDYLNTYTQMGADTSEAPAESTVEVVEVFESQGAQAAVLAGENAGEGAGMDGAMDGTDSPSAQADDGAGAVGTPVQEAASSVASKGTEAEPGESQTAVAEAKAPAPPAAFNPEDFKKNHATFRGFMGQGISYHKHIPVNWDGSTGEGVKWKVAISKHGYNSPVIWDDRIFVSGGDNSARIVAAYNRHTGQLLWENEVKDIPGSPATPPRTTEDTGLAAPTMAVDGKGVYAIFATGDVIAFDMEGQQIWARNLGVPRNHYGHSSSLALWGKFLVVQYDTGAGGRMMALDTSTGESIWDVQRPVHISWASPTLIEVDGKIQIVTSSDPYVSGHDLETGEELWKVEAMMGEVAPSVGYEDGLVFATNEYARLIAVEPKAGAEFVWEDDEYLSEVASPVAYKGLLYVATSYGVLVCYDTKTGEKYWEKEYGNGFYSSPVVADDRLYIIDMGGIMHIIQTDKAGTVVAEPKLGEKGFALPVFADGLIYIRGDKNLFCIE